jgi:hypothetical protein
MKNVYKFLFASLWLGSGLLTAQVGIGTTTPAPSSAIDVTSTTKGFLPPRMTEAQRDVIDTPAVGLIIYCTDSGANGEPQFYNGVAWVNMVGGTATPAPIPSVTSPTGKIWMDRNLGASQIATSSIDAASYGDLYQWGRPTDGHQLRNSATASGPVASGSEGSNFITNNSVTRDWLAPQDDFRWNSNTTGGVTKTGNDPCPTGYRVPTEAELQAELVEFSPRNAAGAFESLLKLPVAGSRFRSNGAIFNLGSTGFYWSSTVSGTSARYLIFSSSGILISTDSRADGFSVRCLKD